MKSMCYIIHAIAADGRQPEPPPSSMLVTIRQMISKRLPMGHHGEVIFHHSFSALPSHRHLLACSLRLWEVRY